MSSQARVFRSSASVAATLQPWIAPPSWSNEGMFFGYELNTHRVVFIDFQMLKYRRLINSLVWLILGAKDHGKSTLMKSLAIRSLCMQHGIDPDTLLPIEPRARFHDRKRIAGKGEYSAIVDYLMGEVLELAELGQINLFDLESGMTELDMVETGINVCYDIHGENPQRWGPLGIQVAVHKMLTKMPELASPGTLETIMRTQTRDDANDYFDHVDKSLREEYADRLKNNPLLEEQLNLVLNAPRNIPEDEFLHDSALYSTSFGQLLRANYGKTFGNTTSLSSLMSAPGVSSYDWVGITARAGRLLEGHVANLDRVAIDRNLRRFIPQVNTLDEEASELKGVVHARSVDERVRKARSVDTLQLMAAHFDTDFLEVGDEGSELRGLGNSIFKGMGGRIYGAQPSDDDTMHRMTSLGISDVDAWTTTQLQPFCWGIHVPGQKMRFVQHHLLPSEVPLMQTNQANEGSTTRQPVTSFPHIQQRLAELGSITIGEDVE